MDEIAVRAWALSVVALFLKMFMVALVQGHQRIKHKAFVKPEDAAFFGRVAPIEAERPLVRLGQAALRNDLENIPIFLALSLAYVLLGCWPLGALIYFPAFVAGRALHTIFYLSPRQPWRNLSYQLGVLSMVAISVHIVAAALG